MNEIKWWQASLGDEEVQRIAAAISHGNITMGALTGEFEDRLARYLDVPYVIATTSCSVALLMSLMALEIGPGHEVIIPNRGFIATAHAVLMAGATVILADVQKDLATVCVEDMAEKISPATRGIIPVYPNGRDVQMSRILELATSHHLKVVEDAAQAFGSRNASGHLGTFSDAGCFS